MIDLHCHLLPGIDDGPPELAAALAEARAHVMAGVTDVVCTPHVSHGHRNTSEIIAAGVAALRTSLEAEAIPLRIHTGAEVSLARAIELDDEELRALHLGGGDWLLVEPPLASDVPRLAQLMQSLQGRGHRILVAHPERCAAFHHDGALLGELVKGGALAQVTAGSLVGSFGRTVEKLARTMVGQGHIHVVSSDAHDAHHRAPGLAAQLDEAGLAALTEWSCVAVPSAILHGGEIPPRPDVVVEASSGAAPKRRLFGRRR